MHKMRSVAKFIIRASRPSTFFVGSSSSYSRLIPTASRYRPRRGLSAGWHVLLAVFIESGDRAFLAIKYS